MASRAVHVLRVLGDNRVCNPPLTVLPSPCQVRKPSHTVASAGTAQGEVLGCVQQALVLVRLDRSLLLHTAAKERARGPGPCGRRGRERGGWLVVPRGGLQEAGGRSTPATVALAGPERAS